MRWKSPRAEGTFIKIELFYNFYNILDVIYFKVCVVVCYLYKTQTFDLMLFDLTFYMITTMENILHKKNIKGLKG